MSILQSHVLPLMQWLLGAIFHQNNARPHTARDHKTVFPLLLQFRGLPDPQICLQSSQSEIIWDGELGNPRIRGKVLANMERNVSYASMPNRIVSCIRAREGSTGH
ncbi:hypothetical protein TNCV_770031 [Trichonephila clavipes]|nr:hypothetical protein TNCV_770031 [Trichonephila clavipes]